MEEITLWKGNFLFLVLSFPGLPERCALNSQQLTIDCVCEGRGVFRGRSQDANGWVFAKGAAVWLN